GVVIERGEQDFVARLQFASDGARKIEGDRRHVLTEDHFISRTVEKIGHGGASAGNNFSRAAAGQESAIGVGISLEELFLDSVHHLARDLRAGRTVEKRGGLAVDLKLERRELFAHPGNIEWFGSSFVERRCAHGRCYFRFGRIVSHRRARRKTGEAVTRDSI